MILQRSKLLLGLAGLALVSGAALWLTEEQQTRAEPAPAANLPQLGLMTTLPIYWNEAGSIDEILQGEGEVHWARTRMEQDYRLLPLDTLETEGDLAQLEFLMLAQPRALSPQENVALDNWVRGGGKLLLFADPLLTGHSRFRIGDRRRPQDVALLSPILARWGLTLEFDETQSDAERVFTDGELVLPVQLAGRWAVAEEQCQVAAGALVARCKIGQGRVLAVADAAMLEIGHDHEHGAGLHSDEHSAPLDTLLDMAFESK